MTPEELQKLFDVTTEVQDARVLDERLRTAFDSQQEQTKRRQQAFDRLRSGFERGQFGGLPQTGDVPNALLAILDELKWNPSVEQIARVAPHFPERFGILEVREMVGLLGFESTSHNLKPKLVSKNYLPALLVHGQSLSLLQVGPNGKVRAVDPHTREPRKVSWGEDCRVIAFAKATEKANRPQNATWLNENLHRFTPELWQMFGLTFVINLTVLATSFAVMSIYDKVIPAEAFDTLVGIGVALGLAMAFELIFRWLKSRLIGRTTGRLEYLLGSTIFNKLITLPIQMIVNTPVGDQISRMRQFEAVRDLFSGPFVAVGLEVPFIILFIIGLFAVAGPLGIVPLALVVVYAVVGFLMLGTVQHQTQLASRHQREHYQLTLETVSNLRQIRAFGCEDTWLEKLRERTAESSSARRRASTYQRFLSTLSAAAVPVAGGATVVTGAVMVIEGQLTVGMLIGAMIIIWRVLAPIQQLFLMFSRYTEIAQMFKQIDSMMKLPSTETALETPIRRTFDGRVAFDRVSFRYQGATDTSLMGISFAIEPGELITVEGASGAGKSTLLRLILDIYRPQSGSVLVDGVNVRQIPETELRAAIGYVPQKPVLFHGTIAQNIRLSSPGASDDELEAICEEVGIMDAIRQLPKGINTLLDHATQGTLPGGFNQALSIAQAYARKPSILLLDEPTKNLDHQLEAALVTSLQRRRGHTTIIMVTHRPSHVRLGDRVIKLDRGQLVSFDPPAAPKMAG